MYPEFAMSFCQNLKITLTLRDVKSFVLVFVSKNVLSFSYRKNSSRNQTNVELNIYRTRIRRNEVFCRYFSPRKLFLNAFLQAHLFIERMTIICQWDLNSMNIQVELVSDHLNWTRSMTRRVFLTLFEHIEPICENEYRNYRKRKKNQKMLQNCFWHRPIWDKENISRWFQRILFTKEIGHLFKRVAFCSFPLSSLRFSLLLIDLEVLKCREMLRLYVQFRCWKYELCYSFDIHQLKK